MIFFRFWEVQEELSQLVMFVFWEGTNYKKRLQDRRGVQI